MIEPADKALAQGPGPLSVPESGEPSSIVADIRAIASDLVEFRELLVELTIRDIRIRYKQAVMGVFWAILTPLVLLLSGWILRLAFGRLSGEAPNDAAMAGLAVKSLGWAFFVGGLGFGTASITANLALVTKTYFPREILPLASVLTQLVDAGIGTLALVLALPFFSVHLSTAFVWVIPLVCMLIMITTGECSRMRAYTSKPVMSGSRRSSSTRSGREASNATMASAPV